ncbi:MAG: TonB-dependent receptor, partial [Myxococcales bacterium]
YENGALLPYVPQLVGRADLTYEPRLGQVFHRTLSGQVGGGLTMFHDRPLPYGETGHDAFLVDMRAGLGWGPARLTLDVTNVLDARWFDGEFVYASRFDRAQAAALVPRRHVTIGPPRSALLSLAVTL